MLQVIKGIGANVSTSNCKRLGAEQSCVYYTGYTRKTKPQELNKRRCGHRSSSYQPAQIWNGFEYLLRAWEAVKRSLFYNVWMLPLDLKRSDLCSACVVVVFARIRHCSVKSFLLSLHLARCANPFVYCLHCASRELVIRNPWECFFLNFLFFFKFYNALAKFKSTVDTKFLPKHSITYSNYCLLIEGSLKKFMKPRVLDFEFYTIDFWISCNWIL